MTADTPRQFSVLVDELFSPAKAASWRRALTETYEWVHNAGHDRTVQESAKIRSTSPSTPTETIAASKAHLRRTNELAVRNLSHAKGDLEESLRRMMQALETLDPPDTPDPMRFMRSASNADLDESRAARERRRNRNEAIP